MWVNCFLTHTAHLAVADVASVFQTRYPRLLTGCVELRLAHPSGIT